MNRIRNLLRRIYRSFIPLIYSKVNYKLFLKRTFVELDDKLRNLSCAMDSFADIIKPILIKPPFGKSMLVIAPHHDDESIGCGGAMLLQVKAKKDLQIVIVSQGGESYSELGYKSYEALSEIREQEALSVTTLLNIKPPIFLKEKGISNKTIQKIIEKLDQIIAKIQPESIFVPFFLDHSDEHRLTAYAVHEVLKKPNSVQKVYCYEVWGLCIANVAIKIDAVMQEKQQLIRCYQSQLKATDYLNSTTGLNMYHALHFGAGECEFVENYFEMPVEDYCNTIQSIFNHESILNRNKNDQ